MSSRSAVHALSRITIAALAALTLSCGDDSGGGGVTPPTDPTIGLQTSTIAFSATVGGAAPASQEIGIANTGGGTLDGIAATISYTAGQPSGWLNAVLSATTAPSTLSLTVNLTALPPATYTAAVAVTAAGASNSPQMIAVTLTVAPASGGAPLIALSSATQNFAAPQGGANPAALTVDVTNGGDGTLDGLTATVTYGAGQLPGWLSAALSSTTAPSTLTLTATTGPLPAGTYNGSVAVASAAAGNSPQTVAVTFTVAPPTAGPLIQLSTNTISFNGVKGDPDPDPQNIAVTNGGNGTLSELAASVTFGAGEPAGWLTATLNKKTAPAALTVQSSTATLDPGTYTATVSVSSVGADNSPQNIAVTLTVTSPPAPTLVLSKTSLAFTGNQGGGDPEAQTVDISSGTAGTLDDLIADVAYNEGSGWLETHLSATSLPSTLSVTAHLSGLTQGTYTANIQLSSSTATNSPQVVAVTLEIAPPQ